jgi:AraC-like DNA-binding protein
MPADTLSHLLRAVRLRGAVFYDVEGRPPWVAEAPASRELLPTVMPEAEHLIEFHGVVSGSCWAAIVGEPAVRLGEGDVVLFPRGDAHVLSSAPGLRAARAEASRAPDRDARLPFVLRMDADGAAHPRAGSVSPEGTHVVCGFLGCDARPFNPLLAALPRVLSIQGAAASTSWVAALLRTAVTESSGERPGGEAVLERMSEMLFVEALRRYVDTLPPEQTGWLAGMRDPAVGRVLGLLHASPAESWTLERLCDTVSMSRSSLHERFVHFVGMPPIEYLAQWRMQVASRLLRDGSAKVVRIALDVGYESEAAFARAFKRIVGVTPGAWRRDAHAGAPAPVPD